MSQNAFSNVFSHTDPKEIFGNSNLSYQPQNNPREKTSETLFAS